eukprot:14953990-Ditylum_brightwellii.AAC.1
MNNSGKAIDNKEGTISGRQFMVGNRAGNTKIIGELLGHTFRSKSRRKCIKLAQLLHIGHTD